jgi:hypothetical protein
VIATTSPGSIVGMSTNRRDVIRPWPRERPLPFQLPSFSGYLATVSDSPSLLEDRPRFHPRAMRDRVVYEG